MQLMHAITVASCAETNLKPGAPYRRFAQEIFFLVVPFIFWL